MMESKNSQIFSQVSPNTILRDHRVGKIGLIFGSVQSVAQQYGVDIINLDKFCGFSAPKRRLQMFAEKLHFSLKPYQYNPW